MFKHACLKFSLEVTYMQDFTTVSRVLTECSSKLPKPSEFQTQKACRNRIHDYKKTGILEIRDFSQVCAKRVNFRAKILA